MFDPKTIPGMIEPIEMKMLSEVASSPTVAKAGLIVEFGCFFGRSTACLANGASSWWTPERGGPAILAFDSFGCAEDGPFAGLVENFARQAGVEGLIRRAAGRVDFRPVYEHFTGAAETAGLLKTTTAELADCAFEGGAIGLMHLDAPKSYTELRPVLRGFFPSLAPGGAVVFQDFFYHWSATLIAAVQLLVEAGIVRFGASAASSMVAGVLRAPTVEEIVAIDRQMAEADIAALLDRSLVSARSARLDRPERFAPRLRLAKLQHLWEAGRFAAAQAELAAIVEEAGGRFEAGVFADFQELMAYGFSLRELYEADH